MGIVIDIILIMIIALSAFLGYKKGLVKLGTKLFAGIIAIILTIILYKPVSGAIINNTKIDEKIEDTILKQATTLIDTDVETNSIKGQVTENVTNEVENNILPEQANKIAKSVVYIITAIILFIFIKIALSIVISLMDFVAKMPILKQFNEIGGIIYGIIRGIIIVFVCALLLGVFTMVNPKSTIINNIEDSYFTKIIYKNIVKF